MLRNLCVAALITTLALTQGCASGPSMEGQPFFQGPAEVNSTSATVYFFRQLHGIGTSVVDDVEIDGTLVGVLPAGGYFIVTLPAGAHAVEAHRQNLLQGDLGDGSFTINVEAGKTYFIASEIRQSAYNDDRGLTEVQDGSFGYQRYYFRWALIPSYEAEYLLTKIRLVPATTAKTTTR